VKCWIGLKFELNWGSHVVALHYSHFWRRNFFWRLLLLWKGRFASFDFHGEIHLSYSKLPANSVGDWVLQVEINKGNIKCTSGAFKFSRFWRLCLISLPATIVGSWGLLHRLHTLRMTHDMERIRKSSLKVLVETLMLDWRSRGDVIETRRVDFDVIEITGSLQHLLKPENRLFTLEFWIMAPCYFERFVIGQDFLETSYMEIYI